MEATDFLEMKEIPLLTQEGSPFCGKLLSLSKNL
jgi:hypothetical protein